MTCQGSFRYSVGISSVPVTYQIVEFWASNGVIRPIWLRILGWEKSNFLVFQTYFCFLFYLKKKEQNKKTPRVSYRSSSWSLRVYDSHENWMLCWVLQKNCRQMGNQQQTMKYKQIMHKAWKADSSKCECEWVSECVSSEKRAILTLSELSMRWWLLFVFAVRRLSTFVRSVRYLCRPPGTLQHLVASLHANCKWRVRVRMGSHCVTHCWEFVFPVSQRLARCCCC